MTINKHAMKDWVADHALFLRWWLIFVLTIFGTVLLCLFGVADRIHQADFTRISYLIYCVFMIFTFRSGWLSWKICEGKEDIQRTLAQNETGWFVSSLLMKLGMIGTVLGFIYMLGMSFSNIASADSASLRGALTHMSYGMSTALYTTATGLVFSLILKLQLFNIDYYLENR